jgi:hypothetical protein
MRGAAILVLVAACEPFWNLDAKVTTPDGAPVTEAALSITCPEWHGRAVLTNAHGAGSVGELGAQLPARCTVSVAAPGHAAYTTTFERLCAPRSLDDCGRVRHIDVVMPPE